MRLYCLNCKKREREKTKIEKNVEFENGLDLRKKKTIEAAHLVCKCN